MKKISKYLIMLTSLTISASTLANEQEDAIKSCVVAQEAAMYFNKINHIRSETFNPKVVCPYTTRTKYQWACVTQSIMNGNAPFYSQDQCFRKDPKTIMIGKDEQKKAMTMCIQIADSFNNKSQIEGIDNIRESCGFTRFAHNTQEWACMRATIAQGANFYFAASKCFINPKIDNYYD